MTLDRHLKLARFLVLSVLLSSCMSTRVVFDPRWNSSHPVTYEDYFDYYALGFIGDATVNLQTVCMDQRVHAFRRFKSAQDGLITAFTLGIYSPATVRVWCGD